MNTLTVAAVPTGMNAGVRIVPRCIVIVPVRALPSVAEIEKMKRSVMLLFPGVTQRWDIPGFCVLCLIV